MLTLAGGNSVLIAAANQTASAAEDPSAIRKAFDKVCEAANIHQGSGPPMAYFQIPPDDRRQVKRYVYITFDMSGPRDEGARISTDQSFAIVLGAAVASFRIWLQPQRTLVWRTRPEMERDPSTGRWAIYYRCVQLDDNTRRLAIDWHF